MSLWKSKRSIRCQLLPSKARTFHDWEQRWKNGQLIKFTLKHSTTEHTLKHRQTWSQSRTHPYTHLVNTDSPVRPGHSDTVSPHPERRRFWKTDRDGLETLTPAARSFLFKLNNVYASTPSTGVWVHQLILSPTVGQDGRLPCLQDGCCFLKVGSWRGWSVFTEQGWKLITGSYNAARTVLGLKQWVCQPHKSHRCTWSSSTESAVAAQAAWPARPRLELWP